MAKATKKHRPAPGGRKQPVFSAAEWTLCKDAFTQTKALLGSGELAARELLKALRSGKLPSAVLRVAVDGSETFDLLQAADWEGALINRNTGELIRRSGAMAGMATAVSADSTEPTPKQPRKRRLGALQLVQPPGWFNKAWLQNNRSRPAGARMWFFVLRAELDKLYSSAVGAPTTASISARQHSKPGPKVREDWPTLVASWLIAVACDNPKRLQTVDRLVAEAQTFLQEEIDWAPKDPKELRKKIVELLLYVRG